MWIIGIQRIDVSLFTLFCIAVYMNDKLKKLEQLKILPDQVMHFSRSSMLSMPPIFNFRIQSFQEILGAC